MIDEIYKFKDYNVYDIASSLFTYKKWDPEICVLTAWFVYHKEMPKNWGKFYNLCCGKMYKAKKIKIAERFIPHLKKCYELRIQLMG